MSASGLTPVFLEYFRFAPSCRSIVVSGEARDAIHANCAQQGQEMLRNTLVGLNWVIALLLMGTTSVSAFSAPWRWTAAQYAFVVLSVWGVAVAGIWGWIWLRYGRVSGGNDGKTNLRPFWTFTPLLLIGPPACALGVYVIFKFAIASILGALIVAAGVTLWITASIIWVYFKYPRPRRKRN
jgi:hypothetical protein